VHCISAAAWRDDSGRLQLLAGPAVFPSVGLTFSDDDDDDDYDPLVYIDVLHMLR